MESIVVPAILRFSRMTVDNLYQINKSRLPHASYIFSWRKQHFGTITEEKNPDAADVPPISEATIENRSKVVLKTELELIIEQKELIEKQQELIKMMKEHQELIKEQKEQNELIKEQQKFIKIIKNHQEFIEDEKMQEEIFDVSYKYVVDEFTNEQKKLIIEEREDLIEMIEAYQNDQCYWK